MAKRERDGWRVTEDKASVFSFMSGEREWAECRAVNGEVHITCRCGWTVIPPARALQFASKVKAIAERAAKKAAKEAKDGR